MARALLEPPPGGAVLDLGCGTGAFTRDLAAAVGPDGLVVGLDASPTMLARAAAETSPGNVAYMRADAGRLPFRPAAFDAVCCFAALHPFPDPSAALDEMARVLTSGGRLAVLASRRTGAVPLRPLEAGIGALGVRMFGAGEFTAALLARDFVDARSFGRGLAQYVGARRR